MIYKLVKKFNRSIFALFLMFLAFISCYDNGYEEFVPPTGNINNIQPTTLFTTSTSANDNLSLIFRSYSTDAATYSWDFGDGNSSTEANPDYTYAAGGLYKVKLTTTSSEGLTAIDSANVAPIFVDYSLASVDSQVTFTNLTSGAKNLTWNFGDGDTAEWESIDTTTDPDFSPVHTYKTADVFDVTLTVVNFLDKEFSITKKVEGLVLSTVPEFNFDVNGLVVEFTDESLLAVSHSWDFGDGSPVSTETNPTHTFPAVATYNVTLTTKNDAGVEKSITKGVPVGAVKATKAAIILNGTGEELNDKNDNADAWDMTPSSTYKPNDPTASTASPYKALWNNTVLNKWLEDNVSTSNEGPGISTTNNSAPYSYKLHEPQRRLYQLFKVEVGVVYTIKLWAKNEDTAELSVYIMDNNIPDESTLETENLGKLVVTGAENGNSFKEYSFMFKATTTDAIFYAKPTGDTINSTNEVFVDNISVKTPGF
jgi:PKD repeat protein